MTAQAVAALPFRRVNRRGRPGYEAGLQRHHLLPLQLLSRPCFAGLFAVVDRNRLGFDDFRRNGLLLPADDRMVFRLRLPLHRGPHNRYNAVVAERVGQIEKGWADERGRSPAGACTQVIMRMALLQQALRRLLLGEGQIRLTLNGACPLDDGSDFSDLDAMADAIWAATARAGD